MYMPKTSTAPPKTFIPAMSATTVSTVAVTRPAQRAPPARSRARSRVRFGAASSSRRAKPDSKSRAIPKPVKTPPNAADWIRTKQNWNAV